MKIKVSESTFKRLQKHATPLIDNVEDVILKMLDAYEGKKARKQQTTGPGGPSPAATQPPPRLKGFAKELWDLVICEIPAQTFSIQDVYDKQGPLKERRAHIQELEASIRTALQKLRDAGYIEFLDNRGQYRKSAGSC